MATTTTMKPAEPAPAAPESSELELEQRVILTGISWETYQRLAEEVGDRAVLKSYNRGVLELISPGYCHEDHGWRLNALIQVVTEELNIPFKALGSTTWADPEAKRAVEADECYFLTAEKVAAIARTRPVHARDVPRPDLAVEIDLRRPAVDRSEIYATLGDTEVWRFDGAILRIDRLRDDGTYEAAAASRFLPVPPAEVVRWVAHERDDDDNTWVRRLRAWVRATPAPPAPPASDRR